ncbi:MAG: cohesin domain-containing protein, partial [Halanaerobiaceae bacterium]
EMLEADDVRLADLEEPILRDYFRRQINHEEGYIKFKYDNKYALSLDEDFLIRDDCVIAYLDFTITDLKSEYTHIELDVDYFSGEQERYKISTINGGIDIDNMQDPFVIEAGNRTGKPGEIITVPVYFKGVPEDEISSCDFWLSFDNEALEVVGIEAGELGANPYTNFDSYFSNEEGFVSFLYIIYSSMPDPDEYISEDGIFAYVDFKIKEDVSPGKYPIDLLKIGAFADYDLNVYSVGYVEGSIAVPGSDKSVVINADTVEGQTYDKVTVPIMLEDIPAGGLDNIELQLKFDEDSLRVTDVRPGEVDGVEFNYLSDNSQYKIDFKYSATNPIKDESILAYIDFLIISQENKYSDFECKTGIITDVNDNQYIGVAKGGVNITGIENPIKLDIGSGSGYPSETITIPVSLDNIPDSGVNICDFKISFNDNNFRLIEVRTGEIVTNPEIFSSEITQGSYRYDEGYVSLKYINTGSETDNIYDDGNIAYLDFEVKENKDLGIFPINIVEDSRYYNPDNNLNYVKLDTSDSQGQLEILNDTITLEIGEAEYYDDARVTVPILIKDIPEEGLEKFDFKLSYDSDKIYLLDAKPGENYKDGFSYDPNYRGEFVLSYNPESIENTSSDKDGVLAYLDVEIKPTDSNYCELDLYYNSDENKYNINDIDGGIDIQSEKLQLKLMNVKTAPGDIVKMPIMIENIAGIGLNGFRIKLNFDPAYFEILDVKKGELLMDDDSYDYYIKIDNQEGELLYGSGIDNYVINDGIFAYIEIKVKESIQDGIYPFELENYNLYNSVYYLGNENIDGSTDVSIEVQDNLENEREINVTMGEEVAMPEENITLPLVIENVPETGISNIDFNINFDQENLSLIGVETCDIVPGSFDISSNINTGEVSISLSSEDDIDGNKIYQDGVIAYIDLQINESALNGFSEVNIESISIDEQDDSGINDDSIEMNDGGVHITDESLTLVMDISEELTYGRNEAIIKIKDLPEDGLSKFKFKLKYDEEAINTFYSSTDMENLIISDFERRLDNEFDYMEFKNNSLQNESMIETIEIASIDLDGEIQIFDASLEFDVDYFANEQNYYKVNTEINIIEKEEDEDNNENDENDEDNNDSDEDTKETFKIEIDNIQGKPGEIVTVPIYFKEISDELAESGIINSDFEIDYNNEIFEVVDVRKGEIVPGPDHILQYSIRNFTDNIFIFFMGSLTSKLVISDNGIYAYIDFKIKEDVPLSTSRIYPISFDGIGGLADYNMGILYPEFIEGSIMVEVDNN